MLFCNLFVTVEAVLAVITLITAQCLELPYSKTVPAGERYFELTSSILRVEENAKNTEFQTYFC